MTDTYWRNITLKKSMHDEYDRKQYFHSAQGVSQANHTQCDEGWSSKSPIVFPSTEISRATTPRIVMPPKKKACKKVFCSIAT